LVITTALLGITAFAQSPPTCIPIEDLIREAATHDRTIVTVCGTLERQFEVNSLRPQSASLREPEDFFARAIWLDSIDEVKAIEKYRPEEKRQRSTVEPTLTATEREVYERFRQTQSSVPLVLTGEFQFAKRDAQYGFGHLGAYHYRLIVYKVVKIGS
jgi:hypothetical protein